MATTTVILAPELRYSQHSSEYCSNVTQYVGYGPGSCIARILIHVHVVDLHIQRCMHDRLLEVYSRHRSGEDVHADGPHVFLQQVRVGVGSPASASGVRNDTGPISAGVCLHLLRCL